MENKKLVIFDFDGVLVESLDLWFSVTQTNNPELTKEEYDAMSHGNYIEAFESKKLVYSENGLNKYREDLFKIKSPKPIISFIKNHNMDYIFAIVSSGNELTIKDFLIKEGIEKNFSDILGNETHKSKTTKIISLVDKYKVKSKDTVFITDTLGDILEAHEANVKSVGVLWGLHDREILERGKPEIIIDAPKSLERAIIKILP